MKNKQINSLRGILMLMIMFFHYTYRFQELNNIETINFITLNLWGTIGVAGFFIISGYFIFPKHMENYNIKEFLLKKIIRLFPAYVLCMTITYISINIFGLPGRQTNLIDYILNLVLINGYIGTDYIDGAHWYLTYLILFYIIVAIIAFVEKKYKVDKRKILITWMLASIVTKGLSIYFPKVLILNKLLGSQYTMFIMIGIGLKEIIETKVKNKTYIVLFTISLLSILFTYKIGVFIGISIFLFIFILAIKNKIKILDNKWISYMGDISYVAYLIHQNIGYQMILGMITLYNKYLFIYTFLVMNIVILLATIIHKYYEIYMNKKLSNFIKQKA